MTATQAVAPQPKPKVSNVSRSPNRTPAISAMSVAEQTTMRSIALFQRVSDVR